MSGPLVAPRAFERVRLLSVQPPGYPHSAAFDELALGLRAALTTLGAQVDLAANEPLADDGVNLVFGAHLIAAGVALPPNSIIVNAEQIGGGKLVQPHYLDLLRRHAVLDYSPRNLALLRERTGNDHAQLLRIGYMPVLTRIARAVEQDIDVLFYGSVNERRRRILESLASA